MQAIGGYFELELRREHHYHSDAIKLNSARNCFEYVLITRKYKKVYLPYYTCGVMLQPLQRQHVEYEFYHINRDFEPISIKNLNRKEAFLYTNYFGLKQDCVEELANIYGDRLIVDNAQAFFSPRLPGVDTFYSPRKFFGVPDGGYLYTDYPLEYDFPKDESMNRMQHLLIRADKDAETGYESFQNNESSLDNAPIARMSNLTEKLLMNIEYERIKDKRRRNYKYIDSNLKMLNILSLELDDNSVPMSYPFLQNTHNANLKKQLLDKKIYVPTYWPNVLKNSRKEALEYFLASTLLSIPIDQRYNVEDIDSIIYTISNQLS